MVPCPGPNCSVLPLWARAHQPRSTPLALPWPCADPRASHFGTSGCAASCRLPPRNVPRSPAPSRPRTPPQPAIQVTYPRMYRMKACAHTCPDFRGPLLGLVDVDQQRVQVQAVRQDVIPDIVATNAQMVHAHGVLSTRRELHRFQVRVHRDVDACADQMPARSHLDFSKSSVQPQRRPAAMPAGLRAPAQPGAHLPAMVPWITVPFLSSICTVSFASFMRNLRCSGRGSTIRPLWAAMDASDNAYRTSLTISARRPHGQALGASSVGNKAQIVGRNTGKKEGIRSAGGRVVSDNTERHYDPVARAAGAGNRKMQVWPMQGLATVCCPIARPHAKASTTDKRDLIN